MREFRPLICLRHDRLLRLVLMSRALLLLVAWQAIAQQAASPPQPVVVVSASLQPNIERSCRLWPGGSVEFYSLTAMGRSGSRLPTLSDSDIERIQSLIAQLQPDTSPALMVDLGSAIELWNIGKERLQGKLTGCLATNGIAVLDNSELIQSCQDGRVLGWNLSEVLGQIGAFHQ